MSDYNYVPPHVNDIINDIKNSINDNINDIKNNNNDIKDIKDIINDNINDNDNNINDINDIKVIKDINDKEEDKEEDKGKERERLLGEKIQLLRDAPQPHQRTPEWYLFRHNLITASNAYKAFGTPAQQNQLIYEKCQPLDPAVVSLIGEGEEATEATSEEDVKRITLIPPPTNAMSQKTRGVNTESPLHWGQKYEPLSVLLYERIYHTRIEDFGCIQHATYPFLGASPDGINVDPTSPLYGRMLEIKNPVSREITGIPKHEYWVQMQLQMECCDLDECDFWETKFIELENRPEVFNETSGMILMFTKDFTPKYVYRTGEEDCGEEERSWEEQTVEEYEAQGYEYVKILYWRLEQSNCLLVKRDREWFKRTIPSIERIWRTIEQERVTGYAHRAPKRRVTAASTSSKKLSFASSNSSSSSVKEGVCFAGLLKKEG